MKFTYTNRLMDESLQELEAFLAEPTHQVKAEILGLTQFVLSPIVIHQGCIIVGFPVKPLVLSSGEALEPEKDDLTVRDDCTVRFHAVREGETIYDELEDFHFDAMGVIEI